MGEDMTLEVAHAVTQFVETREIPKSRSRRFASWLKRQFQFSLATLLEWTFAYTLAMALAWVRADRLTARILLGVLCSMLVGRIIFRTEGRRLVPYFVFAVVIGLGAVCGALLLREARIKAAEPLVEADRQALAALDDNFTKANANDALNLTSTEKTIEDSFVDDMAAYLRPAYATELKDETSSKLRVWFKTHVCEAGNLFPERYAIAPNLLEAKFDARNLQIEIRREEIRSAAALREPRYRRERNRLGTRLSQIKEAATDLDVAIAPIPLTADGWSPLLVPVEKRINLRVSCDFIDASGAEVAKTMLELTGLTFEIDPALDFTNINLRVTDMHADLCLDWICRLANCEYAVDRNAGKVRIRPLSNEGAAGK